MSTALHIGTEPVVGLSFAELLPLFEEDRETEVVVMFGEIGGVYEEEAAEVIEEGKFNKPLVAYIAGGWAPEGVRFSHASAIIERGRGAFQTKIKALKQVGAYIADRPEEIPKIVANILKR